MLIVAFQANEVEAIPVSFYLASYLVAIHQARVNAQILSCLGKRLAVPPRASIPQNYVREHWYRETLQLHLEKALVARFQNHGEQLHMNAFHQYATYLLTGFQNNLAHYRKSFLIIENN